ncbi:IclR family transcriptional regulator [Streptomyces sp. V2]|uniref:IclR family transcriptional regulator n=1 Tax=Streptomyces niveiscabiei TaxID=164115 RepID=A0ABW9HUN1_9ACTN|nr:MULTISPECIES: IclR family transcriptional regulator [Streptomyces]PWG14778.1 IclR family transcriptional regulator [Streptomyces sp. V2]QZZ31666.1 IclR family transcriptional regulator [Streptomyces sp. ST1015]
MTTPHSSPERSVVDRTLSILAAFDPDNRTLSLSDISRRCGLPVATVYRIVNKLHGWGALERSADGGYSIGLRLWETACLAPRVSHFVEAAHPHLVALAQQTSAAATIAIRDGRESVCLAFVSDDPHHPAGGNPERRRVPLHATAVGLVLLAHAGETAQQEALVPPLRAYTQATVTDVSEVRRGLVRVRREGHALIHGAHAPGRSSHAVPVRDARGTVVAAVGVSGPPEIVQPVRTAPHLHAAAAAIARGLRADGFAWTEMGA